MNKKSILDKIAIVVWKRKMEVLFGFFFFFLLWGGVQNYILLAYNNNMKEYTFDMHVYTQHIICYIKKNSNYIMHIINYMTDSEQNCIHVMSMTHSIN